MDEIQKALIKAGRKDLAQEYYKKSVRIMRGNEIFSDMIEGSIEVGSYLTGINQCMITLKTSSRGTARWNSRIPKSLEDLPDGKEKNAKLVAYQEDIKGKVIDVVGKHFNEFERNLKNSMTREIKNSDDKTVKLRLL